MSSFKRKGSSKQAVYRGTRISPASLSTLLTSTGIPSLDDILGGGLPLSCLLLTAAPDLHSSYGYLVHKYFIAQGLSSGHKLCIVDDTAEDIVRDIMWTPKTWDLTNNPAGTGDDEIPEQRGEQKIKIAWRYEQMKQFQTTVSESLSPHSTDEYCHNFDLASRVPDSVVQNALRSKQLCFISIQPSGTGRTLISQILGRIADIIKFEEEKSVPSSAPIRVCVPSLGSPQWGDITSKDILYFLHSLRCLLRRYPYACATVNMPPNMSTDREATGWIQKLAWVSDAAFTLSAFSANPSLTAMFPSHHGLLAIHTLPSPHTLFPPSDRFSTLRGLSASAGSTGENNLTFKCTRKRLIFETLHLDIEGGVGERRTTPSAATAVNSVAEPHSHDSGVHPERPKAKAAFATVKVALEETESEKLGIDGLLRAVDAPETKTKKQKKKVIFLSDRPELYDF